MSPSRRGSRGALRLPGRISALAALAAAVLLLAGCSGLRAPIQGGGFQQGASGPFSLTVRVVNELPDAPVDIYLITDAGERQLLGRVTGGNEKSFQLDDPRPKGAYRLGAERPDGHRIPSESFRLDADVTVHWHVPDGPLQVARKR